MVRVEGRGGGGRGTPSGRHHKALYLLPDAAVRGGESSGELVLKISREDLNIYKMIDIHANCILCSREFAMFVRD